MNKNQLLTIGLIVLFLGLQFRWVEEFKLRDHVKTAIQERINKDRPMVAATYLPPTTKPPEWIGWSLLSSGIIITMASLAFKKG